MNFKNMEYFIAVATEGSITKAASLLNVSQQALSNSIARLEEELGCELFDRKQNLSLTYSGKCFLDSCNQMLDLRRQTLLEINDINKSTRGELRIGIGHTRGQAILPLLLPQFSAKYPKVELEVIEDTSHNLEEALHEGKIDVLIGFGPFFVEGAVYHELMTENLSLVVSQPLLDRIFKTDAPKIVAEYERTSDIRLFKDVPFILLRKGDRIRTISDNVFRDAGIKPPIKLETSNIQTAVALSGEGMGMTICPDIYLNNPYVFCNSEFRSKLCRLRFKREEPDRIAIGYNTNRYLFDFAKDFIQLALDTFKP